MPSFRLAAAGAVAAAILMLATAAEQDQQNDDPAQIAAAEAVITKVAHKNTSEIFRCGSSPLIPWYSAALKMCAPLGFVLLIIFCRLHAKVKGDHCGEDRQELLPRQRSPQAKNAKHPAQRQGYNTFDAK